jgi:PAS domain S-box-containing protein
VAAGGAACHGPDRRRAEALLRENEERLRLAVEAGALGTWEVDLTRQVVRFGAEFAAMLGLASTPQIADRATASRHIHPDDLDAVQRAFGQAMAAGTVFRSEYRGRAADGSTRWFVSHGRFLHDAAGTPVRAVGVIRDVTSRREREDRLREMIESREILLREADHRIKNSLQLVASLLGLQRSRLADPDAIAALDNAITRVMAVGQAHKALHQSADLRHVDFYAMLQDLCAHVGTLNPALSFTCDCPVGFQLDTARAIPLGLIVSELLTNAAKHAYPAGAGVIRTSVGVEPETLRIEVADEGVGLPPDAPRRAGLGSSIVRSLAAQVGVAVELASAPGGGTRATLRGPLQPPALRD